MIDLFIIKGGGGEKDEEWNQSWLGLTVQCILTQPGDTAAKFTTTVAGCRNDAPKPASTVKITIIKIKII